MKKVLFKVIVKGKVRAEETVFYKNQRGADLGISRRIGNLIRIGFDRFEISTNPNEIIMYRHVFKGPTIVYKFKTEEVPD